MHYDACPLGHAKLETTALYTRVAVNTIRDVTSPLDSGDAYFNSLLYYFMPSRAIQRRYCGCARNRQAPQRARLQTPRRRTRAADICFTAGDIYSALAFVPAMSETTTIVLASIAQLWSTFSLGRRDLAHPTGSANGRFLVFCARTRLIRQGNNGSIPPSRGPVGRAPGVQFAPPTIASCRRARGASPCSGCRTCRRRAGRGR